MSITDINREISDCKMVSVIFFTILLESHKKNISFSSVNKEKTMAVKIIIFIFKTYQFNNLNKLYSHFND
jgi:hypothetical protein